MGQCTVCGVDSVLTADVLQICGDCLHRHPDVAVSLALKAHAAIRAEFDLPAHPPRVDEGVTCPLCTNACQLAEGDVGLCGLRTVTRGRLQHLAGTPRGALVSWYDDPLPTNCVAAWVCSGSGQRGKVNLAVFYEACTFNCIYCQNWHFRLVRPPGKISAEQLVNQSHGRTHCVCFFGGDPAAQMPHALSVARRLAKRNITICWETNGSMHPQLLEKALDLTLRTGGCIKFDLKAFDPSFHLALTGVSNQRTLENFSLAARHIGERSNIGAANGGRPVLVASTLLVPGYVRANEVGRIARFIAGLDPTIPYALLAFHPSFFVPDLPRTSVAHAREAESAARAEGLTQVRIGNRHLLSHAY